jgi:hypothetical protein
MLSGAYSTVNTQVFKSPTKFRIKNPLKSEARSCLLRTHQSSKNTVKEQQTGPDNGGITVLGSIQNNHACPKGSFRKRRLDKTKGERVKKTAKRTKIKPWLSPLFVEVISYT